MRSRQSLAPHPPIRLEAGRPGRPAQLNQAQILQALRRGLWDTAVRLAMSTGVTGVNQLTDTLFHLLHPELHGRRIDRSQHDLAREWIEIRDRRVRPVLESHSRFPEPGPGRAGSARTFFGIDTASIDANKNPDWRRARVQVPLDFAIIRANYGTVPDPVFLRDWSKLKDAGIVRGGYLFLRFPRGGRWPSPPAVQAKAFIATLRDLDENDLVPSLDVEAGTWQETGMKPAQLLNGVRVAWKTLRDYYGVAPIIYTSARVWIEVLGRLPAPDLAESPLWVKDYLRVAARQPARYGPRTFAGGRFSPRVPSPWGDATNWWIQQYQGDALGLPGFSSTVDMNRFNTTVRGMAGDRVRWLQRHLGITQTGIFDAATEQAVRAFQNKKGISADGVVNPRTFAYLCWSAAPPRVVPQLMRQG